MRQPKRRTVEIVVKRKGGKLDRVTEDLYRTREGYVLDAADALMPWLPTSFWALRDANAEHLRTVDTFHLMAKARNVRDLLRKQDRGGGCPGSTPRPRTARGNVLYADHSVVPNVPDDLATACMTPVGNVLNQVAGLPADGNRADRRVRGAPTRTQPAGVFGPDNLPHTFRKDWVINANDSYWLPNPEALEGFAGIIGCERCERSLRQRMVYRYVMDRLAGSDGLAKGRKVSHRTLKLFEHENRVFGAELAKENDDLVTVCEAAGRRVLRGAGRVGRPLRHRQRGDAGLPGVLGTRAGRHRAVGDAVRRRGPGGHAAQPRGGQPEVVQAMSTRSPIWGSGRRPLDALGPAPGRR